MQLSIKYLVGSKKVRTFASAFEQKQMFLSFEHKERVGFADSSTPKQNSSEFDFVFGSNERVL